MLQDYIKKSWMVLRRNALDVAFDPKMQEKMQAGTTHYLYLSPDEDYNAVREAINQRGTTANIELRILPASLDIRQDHGLLYLPYDYVVPGDRFNEMYAWDSYWIIIGLMRDGYADLAIGMVKNFWYQIRYYGGKVLNSSRTYCLDRSQPPLLAHMVTAVLPCMGDQRRRFLREAVDALSLEYTGFWKKSRYDPHHGLFHYGEPGLGDLGFCPEAVYGERDDKGFNHYDKVAAYLRGLPADDIRRHRFVDETSAELTPAAVAGDRAMRESGFDTSMHMGSYGLETPDYAPICLNSLLYSQCRTMEIWYRELGEVDQAAYYCGEAVTLYAAIQKTLWNKDTGLFCNFNRRENRLSDFRFLTCVYPLWAGIASPQQAEQFRDNLPLFETAFGIKNTPHQTGCQWDSPFMWAPLVYFTVEGLRNYGFNDEAKRIAGKFTATTKRVYERTGANFEKYNADTGDCHVDGIIDVGYSENVVGFGWTNGVAALYLDERMT